MSASSRNFANAGNGPLGNLQFQIGPDGTLRFVPMQTTTESSTESTPPVEVQDPESIAREEESSRIAMERWERFREMNQAKRLAKIPPPPNPEMITYPLADRDVTYPIEIPEDPNWVWVSHRDHPGQWRRIGTPIKEEEVGSTYFREPNRPQTYQPIHRGLNAGQESLMTDDQLKESLRGWNLPTKGDRYSIFDRVVRVKTNPTVMQKLTGNEPLTEQERQYVLGGDRYPKSANLLQAEREQGMRDREAFLSRRAQTPQATPSSLNQPSTNNPLQGTTTTTTTSQPPNVVQPPLQPPPQEPQGPLYGGTMRLGDEAPMSTSVIGRAPSQTQTMTQPSLSSRIMPQANTGAAVAEEAGAMGGMEMMASRALPMLNMVFMGKMLADGLTSGAKEKKMQQQALMYRT